jgi:hypothetical protein
MKTRMILIFSIWLFPILPLLAQDTNSQENQTASEKFLSRYYSISTDTTRELKYFSAIKSANDPKWPSTMYYNTEYTAGLFGTPTIPITFNRLQIKDGKAQLGTSISMGVGYTWFFGDFTFLEDGSIKVDHQFLLGIAGDFSIQGSPNEAEIKTGATLGGFLGFKQISLFAGYDFVNKSYPVGIGARLDFFSLSSDKFYPYGTIRPVREPRTDAKIIERK